MPTPETGAQTPYPMLEEAASVQEIDTHRIFT